MLEEATELVANLISAYVPEAKALSGIAFA